MGVSERIQRPNLDAGGACCVGEGGGFGEHLRRIHHRLDRLVQLPALRRELVLVLDEEQRRLRVDHLAAALGGGGWEGAVGEVGRRRAESVY